MTSSFYQKHLFFCINQKAPGKKCCQLANATQFFEYAKKRIQELGLWGEGKIRVSSSGCLGRCSQGPALVIYPEGVWYTYHSFSDIDMIIDQHLVQGNLVPALQIFVED